MSLLQFACSPAAHLVVASDPSCGTCSPFGLCRHAADDVAPIFGLNRPTAAIGTCQRESWGAGLRRMVTKVSGALASGRRYTFPTVEGRIGSSARTADARSVACAALDAKIARNARTAAFAARLARGGPISPSSARLRNRRPKRTSIAEGALLTALFGFEVGGI